MQAFMRACKRASATPTYGPSRVENMQPLAGGVRHHAWREARPAVQRRRIDVEARNLRISVYDAVAVGIADGVEDAVHSACIERTLAVKRGRAPRGRPADWTVPLLPQGVAKHVVLVIPGGNLAPVRDVVKVPAQGSRLRVEGQDLHLSDSQGP
eukprot:UN4206